VVADGGQVVICVPEGHVSTCILGTGRDEEVDGPPAMALGFGMCEECPHDGPSIGSPTGVIYDFFLPCPD
jgi:hypothetical protein